MTTDLLALEARARRSSITLADLEQMKINALDKQNVEAAKLIARVILERYPIKAKSGGGRTPTAAAFRGEAQDFESGKDAYLWLVERFHAFKPTLFEGFAALSRPRSTSNSGTRFAREPDKLFPLDSKRAGNASYFSSLTGGWFADTNLNHQDKFATLLKLGYVCGLEYPTQWEFRPIGGTEKFRQHQAAVVRARELLAELLCA